METEKFSEKESLELISNMINATRNRKEKRHFRIIQIYGVCLSVLSLAIFLAVYYTESGLWNFLYALAPAILLILKKTSGKPDVVTYFDSTIDKMWRLMLMLFAATIIWMLCSMFNGEKVYWALLMPLSIIFICAGTIMTGIQLKENKWVAYPVVAIMVATGMLVDGAENYTALWNIRYIIGIIFSMVLPQYMPDFSTKQNNRK